MSANFANMTSGFFNAIDCGVFLAPQIGAMESPSAPEIGAIRYAPAPEIGATGFL